MTSHKNSFASHPVQCGWTDGHNEASSCYSLCKCM